MLSFLLLRVGQRFQFSQATKHMGYWILYTGRTKTNNSCELLTLRFKALIWCDLKGFHVMCCFVQTAKQEIEGH